MKRSIQFSADTERDLKRLALTMHSGNITATVSELIRTECRRRFGENYDIEPTSEVVTTPQVVPVMKKKKSTTPQVVSQSEAHTTSEVVVDAPSHVPEPPPEASLPDPFTNPIVEVPFDPEVPIPAPKHPEATSGGNNKALGETPERLKQEKRVLVTPEQLEAAAKKLAAKKAAPKPITGITSVA
jgi:hypothetical protein